MKMNITFSVLFILALWAFSSCTFESATAPNDLTIVCSDTISYRTTIEPIIRQSCATSGCHGTTLPQAGVILVNYNQVAAEAANGRLVCVTQGQSCVLMPPLNSLDSARLQQIECWVYQGYPNN